LTAYSGKCPRSSAAEALACTASLRTSLAETPMCRHSNPLPVRSHPHGCQEDWNLILAALEQQNALLTELLGAITGLTAACLCLGKSGS